MQTRARGITPTARILGLAEVIGRFGPLTRTQLVRALRVTVPDLVVGPHADRLLRRELRRLRDAGVVQVQPYPGTNEPLYTVTSTGDDLLLGHGRLTETRGDVLGPYLGQPSHSRLIRDVAVTVYCARHTPSLTPAITKFAWDEHPVFVIGEENTLGNTTTKDVNDGEHMDNMGGTDSMDMDNVTGMDDLDVALTPASTLYPDALAYLTIAGDPRTFSIAVEADLSGGERPHGEWGAKVSRYRAFWKSVVAGRTILPSGPDPDTSTVLVVTPSLVRAKHLAIATADMLGTAGPAFVFTTPTLWTETTFWDRVAWPAGLGRDPTNGQAPLFPNRVNTTMRVQDVGTPQGDRP